MNILNIFRRILQDDPVDLNPPVNTGGNTYTPPATTTNPYNGTAGGENGTLPVITDLPDFQVPPEVYVMVFAIIVGIGLLLYLYLDKRQRRPLSQTRPHLSHLNDNDRGTEDWNRTNTIEMILMLAIFYGGLFGTMYSLILGGVIMSVGLTGSGLFHFWKKSKALEKSQNIHNLRGWMYDLEGDKEEYKYSDVKFGDERMITDDERAKMVAAFPEWEKILDDVIAVPMSVKGEKDTRPEAIIVSNHHPDTWTWVTSTTYHAYGKINVKLAGPVFREFSRIHEARLDETEEADGYDAYIPVFLVMFDDSKARQLIKAIKPVDVTREEGLAGISKAMVVSERTTAGKHNATSQQLVGMQKDGKGIYRLAHAIGRKKAKESREAESLITMDILQLGTVSVAVAILVTVMATVIGAFIGYMVAGG